MKNKTIIISIVAIVAILAIYFLFLSPAESDNLIELGEMYDSDGEPVNSNTLSIVNGVQGVKYISLNINVENKDTVPLTLRIIDYEPMEIADSIPNGAITLDAGASSYWETDLIDIEPYEGIVQTICITVESDDTLTRKSQSITGCIDIEVEQEEASEAYFEVSVDSSIGSSTVNPGCDESWSCTEYGDCENGIEERTCTDINQCGTETSNPEEIQSCEEIGFSTNADGNYAVHGVWIDWGLKKYYYNGKSTFRCTSKGATEIGTTPEGYRICTRLGYDIESRVYLDDGNNGLIFK